MERSDQRVSWERSDQAFFAAGACHILAWACRELHEEQPIELVAVRFRGEVQVFHAFAAWGGWAYDHAGWNPEVELLAVNQAFEGQPLERLSLTASLAEFCEQHHHRMPEHFWRDPMPRAREYAARARPPWR